MSSFVVKTFGCKVNTYDSGLLQKHLQGAGFAHDSKEPEVFVLNSCAVTAEATKEVLRQARRLKKDNPSATVVLTGCAAQVDGALVDCNAAVDLVIANSHKQDLGELLKKHLQGQGDSRVYRSNIFRNENLGEGGGEEASHTRSYLKIQDGCNSFCSFCVIPFARGKSRSLPVPMLLEKIRDLHSRSVHEVVLTGVHIGDYCDEQTYGGPFQLDDLVEQVLLNTKIERIRLTSLEPLELSDKLMRLYQNPRMCPHFHMSLQSLSTSVLKGMRRNYSAEQVGEALLRIAQELPHAFVGLDVITGFPGESDELFLETYENLKKWPWSRIHVFPYSERSGTRAEQMTATVPWNVRKHRAKILRDLSRERFEMKAAEQLGKKKQILILKEKESVTQGLSEDYWNIVVENNQAFQPGELHSVRVKGYERGGHQRMTGHLIGEPL